MPAYLISIMGKMKKKIYGFLDINLNFRMIKKNGVYKYNNTHIIVDFSIINRTYETQTNSWRLFFLPWTTNNTIFFTTNIVKSHVNWIWQSSHINSVTVHRREVSYILCTPNEKCKPQFEACHTIEHFRSTDLLCLEWKYLQTGENNKSVKMRAHQVRIMIEWLTLSWDAYKDQRFWCRIHGNRTNHNSIKTVRLSCRPMSCQLHQGLIVGLDRQTGWTKQTCPSFPEKKKSQQNNILFLELSFFRLRCTLCHSFYKENGQWALTMDRYWRYTVGLYLPACWILI